jgi:hypothetical protein
MTRLPGTAEDDFDDLLRGAADLPLHSFAVIARFVRAGDSADAAEKVVREELQTVRDQYDDVKVEPPEPDGSWAVDVRFVVASLDGETALQGVHTTLRENGLAPDEAWVAERLP